MPKSIFSVLNIKEINQFQSLSIKTVVFLCLSSFINVQAQQVFTEKTTYIDTSYLESKNQLSDYILDTGDTLDIEFINVPNLSGSYRIDEQGEIFLERLKYTYVRGLTIKELTHLLEERYKEFLINPEINIIISQYKPIRVAIKGEVRSPGLISFPSFISTSIKTIISPSSTEKSNLDSEIFPTIRSTNSTIFNNTIKRDNDYITTLSNAIQGAGGLTSSSDISKIEIIRDIPIGKGGGKKRAIIDFRSYIKEADTRNDIRLFDGDSILIPKLKIKDKKIIPNSILSGLSPKFINVEINGQIENPGTIKIPIEGSLSDLMSLTGPRKPLAGKVFLIRYNQDGTLLRKNIKYSSNASPGSRQNPYLVSGDLITIKNSILGRASGTISAITQPIVGIYSTKELYETITGN